MSSKTNITTTTNTDNSNLQAGTLGFRGDGNTTSVVTNTLDAGAVAGAIDLSGQALTANNNAFSQAIGFLSNYGQTSTSAAINAVQQANSQASQSVADAYGSSTGALNKNTVLMLVAGAVVVIGALYFMRGRK
jgi:hypothetical protein